ncbi:MAG: class I tRNA ligase family protein, partial [Armatimonadetes bacterium]|nr:class I tRNA ligase family protein [Armatimonadota bacterium]
IAANPTFLLPETRRNEVLAMIEDGLRDIAISRKNAGWGIEVPGDPGKVFYVWFDALINYLSNTGWPENENFDTLWPADAHLMAKEIYARFHATFWPAMLMGLGLPLPKHVVGHGWWTVGGEKGSKSKGNIPAARARAISLSPKPSWMRSLRPVARRRARRKTPCATISCATSASPTTPSSRWSFWRGAGTPTWATTTAMSSTAF